MPIYVRHGRFDSAPCINKCLRNTSCRSGALQSNAWALVDLWGWPVCGKVRGAPQRRRLRAAQHNAISFVGDLAEGNMRPPKQLQYSPGVVVLVVVE
jgi:hypothetical protein